MINIPPTKYPSPLKVENIADVIKPWKVGEVLSATAQKGGEALSTVLIRVGQYTLKAKTPVSLQDGEAIKLQVKAITENKLPLLRIMTLPPNANDQSADKVNIAAIKLRQFIAIQQNFSQTLQLASDILKNEPKINKLPEPLNNSLIKIQSTLQLGANNTTPSELKQKILNSGLFFESKLLNLKSSATTNSPLSGDFKQQLLSIKNQIDILLPANKPVEPLSDSQLQQLKNLIQQSANDNGLTRLTKISDGLFKLLPASSLTQLNSLLSNEGLSQSLSEELTSIGKLLYTNLKQTPQLMAQLQEQIKFRLQLIDLGQQVEQSISKISSLQLQPLTREGDNLFLIFFNLIFKDSQQQFDINFKIQQDSRADEQDNESWSVILSFNFKTLGTVQSKIHLVGNQLSTSFHTEQAQTASKIKQLLPLLESALTKSGFNIVNINVDNTLMKNRPFPEHQTHLLDENA